MTLCLGPGCGWAGVIIAMTVNTAVLVGLLAWVGWLKERR